MNRTPCVSGRLVCRRPIGRVARPVNFLLRMNLYERAAHPAFFGRGGAFPHTDEALLAQWAVLRFRAFAHPRLKRMRVGVNNSVFEDYPGDNLHRGLIHHNFRTSD